ncbi:MAG: HlyD family efflux transporter periplasmic adaptor subunit [Deltaproteobacteria bacterium]|nr:HlyD family efflux transporter periplasmic adaptor subunit [Deltaproteobacteria bacterium]MBW1965240.1 HlyD family efflux transporter periplasmic adaptor subunit [Deltaproteobacteria bacterium]MBW2080590.1 HlyD family efflux transporter periplasmic adaptor subunit [Deltaproteobacteria bacterium]
MKNYIIGTIIIFLILLSGFFIYQKLYPTQLPPNLVAGTGRIDGDIIALNTKYTGRIKTILIEDGQSIHKGNTIAILQSDELEAKLESIEKGVQSSQKGLEALQKDYEIAEISIPLAIEKARTGVDIAIAQKEQLLRSIDNLNLVIIQDKRDFARAKRLSEKNLIAKNAFELSSLKLDNDINKLESLHQGLSQTTDKINISRTDLKIAQNQLKRLDALKATIEAARNQTASLEANKREVSATIKELTLISPIDGVVIEKVAQTGEVLAPGMVVATLIDPEKLYLKMFVDTLENGKIKLKDKAVIFLDSFPDMPIQAIVLRIGQRAEFTPKEVSVKSDRIQRMYAVHLKPVTPNSYLKLGIPAIGVISTDGKGLPKSSGILGDL